MPFWAFLHFYDNHKQLYLSYDIVSMPFWAFLHFYQNILRLWQDSWTGVNALLGFPSFLQHPSGTRRNKAFSRPFLRVFIWKFWKKGFSDCFLYCSQFVHILIQITPAHKTSVLFYYTTLFLLYKVSFIQSHKKIICYFSNGSDAFF